jgi:hypothetical protein
MDIKKVLKGLDKQETSEILLQSSLTLEELALARSLFVEHKPRSYFCDDFGCSLGKYHYMLNRVITKIQSYLKFKLFAK